MVKTAVAEALSRRLNARCFHIDDVLKEHGLTSDREDGYISQKSFLKVNEILAPQANKLLNDGTPVIFDGNFYWKSQIEDLIQRLGFPHYVFTLQAPFEVCVARDAQRNPPHGEDAVRAVYAKAAEFDYGTIIDATRSIDDCVHNILTFLGM